MIGLPYVRDEAIDLADHDYGMSRVDWYARNILHDADEYASNPDWGESVTIMELDDEDRVAFVLLMRLDVAKYGEDWPVEAFADAAWMVCGLSGGGFANPLFYATEEEARAVYEPWAAEVEEDNEEWGDEEEEWVTDDPTLPAGTTAQIDGYSGVAWRIEDTRGDEVRAHMVGDDRTFTFDRDDVTVLAREDYCGECGQIGCTADGYDREGGEE